MKFEKHLVEEMIDRDGFYVKHIFVYHFESVAEAEFAKRSITRETSKRWEKNAPDAIVIGVNVAEEDDNGDENPDD